MNRAELLKILVEGTGVTPDENTYKNCFSDVSTDWYAKYVCYAKEEGWVSGYPDGTFKPADAVNKVEALKMLLLSQDVELSEELTVDLYADVEANDWFAAYVETANDLGILEENEQYFQPDGDKDRQGIAENLYRLLLNLETSNVAEAMSEVACFYYADTAVPFEELEEEVLSIVNEHGYESDSEIDDYLDLIRDFEFFSTMEEALASELESCSDDLAANELTPEDMAEQMLWE